MKHKYFVSYSHNNGFGMIEIFTDLKVKTYDDVIKLRETIKETNGLDVIILNWIKLKGN